MEPIIENVTVQGGGSGTGIGVTGSGPVPIKDVQVENMGTGIDLTKNSSADLSGATIERNQTGMRVGSSDFILSDSVVRENEIGIDLQRGARGDILEGEVLENSTDIRYSHDVLVGVFDTAAKDVLDRTSGNGLEEIDSAWLANEILWTTDTGKKARNIVKIARKAAITGVSSVAISEAYRLAKLTLGL